MGLTGFDYLISPPTRMKVSFARQTAAYTKRNEPHTAEYDRHSLNTTSATSSGRGLILHHTLA